MSETFVGYAFKINDTSYFTKSNTSRYIAVNDKKQLYLTTEILDPNVVTAISKNEAEQQLKLLVPCHLVKKHRDSSKTLFHINNRYHDEDQYIEAANLSEVMNDLIEMVQVTAENLAPNEVEEDWEKYYQSYQEAYLAEYNLILKTLLDEYVVTPIDNKTSKVEPFVTVQLNPNNKL